MAPALTVLSLGDEHLRRFVRATQVVDIQISTFPCIFLWVWGVMNVDVTIVRYQWTNLVDEPVLELGKHR